MPVRAQKVLSKPINAQISREVRAQITSDTSLGATERRERAEETTAAMSGDVLRAHPWQSSQTLSLGSHEVLCWLA
jgi:antitoxin component of MazEF toxin-antitoxin module